MGSDDTALGTAVTQSFKRRKDVLDCEESLWDNLKKTLSEKPYCAKALKKKVTDLEIMAIIFLIVFAVGFCLIIASLNTDGSLNGNVAPNTSIAAWSFGVIGLVFFLGAMITVIVVGGSAELWLDEVTNSALLDKSKTINSVTN